MKILALDTAMAACSAAVVETDGGHVLAAAHAPMERGHAEAIAPMVQQVMAASGLGFAGIDRIAVTIGPGTFTGVRIGLSMARGLSLATGIPVAGIDTLQAIAINHPVDDKAILIAADARKNEVYTALFDARRQVLRPPNVATVNAAADGVTGGTWVIGSGAEAVINASGRNDLVRSISGDLPVAAKFAWLASVMPLRGEAPSPLYLRAPDAKPQTAMTRRGAGPSFVEADEAMAEVLAGLHADCFDVPWNAAAFRDLLAMPGAAAIVAIENGLPAGFILTRQVAEEAEIITIGVGPAARRQGVARAMLDHQFLRLSAAGVHQIFIEVGQSNVAARGLYSSLGFSEAGQRRAYYELPGGRREDAIVMRKDLTL